jgi:hypothetical protein
MHGVEFAHFFDNADSMETALIPNDRHHELAESIV